MHHTGRRLAITSSPIVLVVDDELAVREVCYRTLRAAGCTPVLAANAAEALALVPGEDCPFDAAIVDIVLPDIGGLELIRILRDRGCVRHVVCTSGYPPDFLPENYQGQMENCFFLQKPLAAQQLRGILAEALRDG